MSTESTSRAGNGASDPGTLGLVTGELGNDSVDARVIPSLSLLQATLDAAADGILVVDRRGRIVSHNRRFRQIFGLADRHGDAMDLAALDAARQLLDSPKRLLDRFRALSREPDRRVYEVVGLRDGRVLELHSQPQRLGQQVVGRVWTFRDITEQRRMQGALIASERRYRRLFEDSRHALYITRRDGSFVEVNRAMLGLFGYSRQELLRLNAGDVYVDRRDRDRFHREMDTHDSVRNFEVELQDRYGRTLDCLITANARRAEDGTIVGYEGIIEDVTERKRSTEALRQSERYFRSLIENALDTITILKADGTISYESPSVERVLGYAPDELMGTHIFDYIHPADLPSVREVFARTEGVHGATAALELRFRHRDGTWRTLEAVGKNLLHDPVVSGVVVNARDVTERKEAEDRLLHDAFHDGLTGLPNRALFMDRLQQLVKRNRRTGTPGFTVLFLDLDRFKVVNDSLGHSVGDQLLVEIGRRLETCLRPGDTVARVGGDEFALLLDGTPTSEKAGAVADRIHRAMERPFLLARREVYATISIGIAVSDPRYRRAEEMLRDADIAMYRSKNAGRSRSEVFDRTMHEEAVAMLELETALRQAIERDELVLHYQPIVSLRDGRLLGFESLVRWLHPSQGLLHPDSFLELAEDTGLIVPMGLWTLEEAARQAAGWAKQGFRPYVAVNLSATQLSQPDLVDQIRTVLERTGTPAELLRLELTETVLMEHAESAGRTIEELRSLGVALMIDDFGIGYSSLSYLHRFATDTLKIDGSFIGDIGPNGENSEIVRTIVALADELGMDVVAEGVETREQFRMVRILGCRSAQGYHLGEPAPADETDALLRRVWDLP